MVYNTVGIIQKFSLLLPEKGSNGRFSVVVGIFISDIELLST
jgi:hypothetical protein